MVCAQRKGERWKERLADGVLVAETWLREMSGEEENRAGRWEVIGKEGSLLQRAYSLVLPRERGDDAALLLGLGPGPPSS